MYDYFRQAEPTANMFLDRGEGAACNCPTQAEYTRAINSGENCQTKFFALSELCKSECKTKKAWIDAKCAGDASELGRAFSAAESQLDTQLANSGNGDMLRTECDARFVSKKDCESTLDPNDQSCLWAVGNFEAYVCQLKDAPLPVDCSAEKRAFPFTCVEPPFVEGQNCEWKDGPDDNDVAGKCVDTKNPQRTTTPATPESDILEPDETLPTPLIAEPIDENTPFTDSNGVPIVTDEGNENDNTKEKALEELKELAEGSDATCNGVASHHECKSTMSIVVGLMGHGFGQPLGFDYSMKQCGFLFTQGLMKRVGLFQDVDEVEENTPDNEYKMKLHKDASKQMETQKLSDQLQRNTENMERGRCNPECRNVDYLHSMAWTLPPIVAQIALRVGAAGVAALASNKEHMCHHLHLEHKTNCRKFQFQLWKKKKDLRPAGGKKPFHLTVFGQEIPNTDKQNTALAESYDALKATYDEECVAKSSGGELCPHNEHDHESETNKAMLGDRGYAGGAGQSATDDSTVLERVASSNDDEEHEADEEVVVLLETAGGELIYDLCTFYIC